MFDAQGLFTELYDWITQTKPDAIALVKGPEEGKSPKNGSDNSKNSQDMLDGVVYFYQTEMGVLVMYSVGGLPINSEGCSGSIFAMHIHDGGSCTGTTEDPFADTDGHYNPYDCPHPYHAGDLPPLFSNGGYAFGAVLTTRFGVKEVLGKTVVIHSGIDDFTSQPAGNSGKKIGCGVIREWKADS